jgi:hypothetical protein
MADSPTIGREFPFHQPYQAQTPHVFKVPASAASTVTKKSNARPLKFGIIEDDRLETEMEDDELTQPGKIHIPLTPSEILTGLSLQRLSL